MKTSLPTMLSCALALGACADEGLWLFNQPPRELLRERYGFDAAPAWLDHLQKASIRFNSGGSGSFVSEDGLLISNHHVGADALQKLSTAQRNYLRDGFFARTPADEARCLDLELNVLQSIEDVTARVNDAVPKSAAPGEAFAARRRIIAAIEKESVGQTGLRSDVVTLWLGGAYHLYRYKRYTDVRLVFAPEQQIAFYGGDPDNFEFPRHDLDICLFRAYENGRPARVKDFLRFSRRKGIWSLSPATPRAPIACSREPSWRTCAITSSRSALNGSNVWRSCSPIGAPAARKTHAARARPCSPRRTPAKHTMADWPASCARS